MSINLHPRYKFTVTQNGIAIGPRGYTPYIQDGNWYINGTDTGVRAEGLKWSDLTPEQKDELMLKFEYLTPEQKAEIKGEKGDSFTYSDFTQEQIDVLQKPAKDAAAIANQAAETANSAAMAANQAAGYAGEAGDDANNAAALAVEKALLANEAATAATLSKEQADAAEILRQQQEQTRIDNEEERIASGAVIQSQIANNLTETAAGKVLDARQGKVLSDADATIIADEKAIVPSIAFYKRVLADSGTIGDKTILAKLFTDKLKSLSTTQVLYMPHLGLKERTSGMNKFASKIYDAGLSNLDAVQATEATQPFIGGFIAPNSLKALKYVQGQLQSGNISFTEKIYSVNDSWTLTIVLKINKYSTNISENSLALSSTSYLGISNSGVGLRNWGAGVTLLSGQYAFECGKTVIIELFYSNGIGLIKVNGQTITTSVLSSIISYSKIDTNTFDGSLYYFHLQNERISEAESQQNYTLLRALFPDIEGIAIGNQFWASSNYEGTVAGDGTIIPEVRDAAAWAAATTPAWCYYNNDPKNGAICGKLYNWYAIELFSKYPPKGWRVPSSADFTQLRTYLGGTSVAGGKIKKEGYIFWQSPNLGADNQSGFSAIGSGYRVEGVNFTGIRTEGAFWTNDKYRSYIEINAVSIVFSNVSAYLHRGFALRLLRNSPVGDSRRQIESGYFTTDIASAAKSIAIPFGYVVKEIRITTTTSVTSIEAKLHNMAGTAVATLITGKACNTTSTTFIVTADQPTQLTDPTIRVTAAGNSAASIGMNITAILEKIEL